MELRELLAEKFRFVWLAGNLTKHRDGVVPYTLSDVSDEVLFAIHDWGNEPCPHLPGTHAGIGAADQYDLKVRSRRECAQCWQELKESK